MQKLTQVIKTPEIKYIPKVFWEVDTRGLTVHFEIRASAFHVSSQFKDKGLDNHGLWNFDVLELFLSRQKQGLPYLEWQISPLGQQFALYFSQPRKMSQAPSHLDISFEHQYSEKLWQGKIFVPEKHIPGEGAELFGNIHACFGDKNNREYYALFGHQDGVLDFHRPAHFAALGNFL